MKLAGFKEVRKGGLVGFATVELSIGLTIHDVAVCESHGKAWAGLPGKPVLDRDGRHVKTNDKGQYVAILKWRDRALSDRFSDAVIELVRAQYPAALP
jgi:hypothetical protein